MDTEQVQSFDTLMPSPEGELVKSNRSGKEEFVKGRYFVIRRPVPINETANPALKQMIKDLNLKHLVPGMKKEMGKRNQQ